MTSQKRIFTLLTFSLVFLIAAGSALGQSKELETDYEATLYVLADKADTGTAMPRSLNTVSQQIKNDLGAANLRLINTYVSRLSTLGSVEYKGISNAYTDGPVAIGNPTFLDWRLMNMKPAEDSAGQGILKLDHFRFGARVPVRLGVRDDNDKSVSPINYESIGLTVTRMNIREGIPTLVGTLTQPKTDGTLYLVLTVKEASK